VSGEDQGSTACANRGHRRSNQETHTATGSGVVRPSEERQTIRDCRELRRVCADLIEHLGNVDMNELPEDDQQLLLRNAKLLHKIARQTSALAFSLTVATSDSDNSARV
jgi:hypothetical protein